MSAMLPSTRAAVATVVVAAARTHEGDSMLYREFRNMKPPEFDGVKDPIDTMI